MSRSRPAGESISVGLGLVAGATAGMLLARAFLPGTLLLFPGDSIALAAIVFELIGVWLGLAVFRRVRDRRRGAA